MSKFFLDFEATQFSDYIISIGCIAENGNVFHTICQPSNPKERKITKFITNLTGITQNMIDHAISAQGAFYALYAFVEKNNEGIPEYYSYGNNDKHFLERTVKYFDNFSIITFTQSIIGTIIDYEPIAMKHLGSNDHIGLFRLYNSIHEQEAQTHNALDDAKKLKYVFDNIDKIAFDLIPAAADSKVSASQFEVFKSWPNSASDKYKANTLANKANWKYKIQNCNNKNGVKYFLDMDMALRWYFRYCHHEGYKSKNQEDIVRFKKNVEKSIKDKTKFLGYKWEVNENV